jgi:hypothetical protein
MINNKKYPIERENIVPDKLDYTLDELRFMSNDNFASIMEKLRQHLIDLVEFKNHPIFGSEMSIDEINRQLHKLNSGADKCKFFKPDYEEFGADQSDTKDGALHCFTRTALAINQWLPEMYLINKTNGKTLIDQLFDKEVFLKNMDVIINQDRLKYYEKNPEKKLTQVIKSGLRIVNGNKPAYNFSPDIAKWVYTTSAYRLDNDIKDFYILDTSAGWYGRLAGCLASANSEVLKDKTVHYYCTDVNTSIDDRFYSITNYWQQNINPDIDFDYYKSTIGSEEIFQDERFSDMIGSFDISFTSIPYFNAEQYSDDEEQSYIKYQVYDNGKDDCWKYGFLHPTIDNIHSLLKKGGEFWINVADVRCTDSSYGLPYYTLEYDTVDYAKSIGFSHIYTYKMLMPLMPNLRKNKNSKQKNIAEINGKTYKYEPIFVFRKEEL